MRMRTRTRYAAGERSPLELPLDSGSLSNAEGCVVCLVGGGSGDERRSTGVR